MKKIVKKTLVLLLAIIMIFSAFPIAYANNLNYIIVKSASDLYEINNNLSGHFILGNDIDLSSYGEWSPIGSSETPFTGTLDGNGYEIKNLQIDLKQDIPNGDKAISAAFFNVVSGGVIKNIGITNASIKNNVIGSKSSEHSYCNAQGFAGELLNGSLIENCYFQGSVSAETNNNSFARSAAFACCVGSTIKNCYADINLSAKADYANTMVGGIAAWNDSTTIDKCYVTGSLYAQNSNSYVYAGGIVGSGNGTVSNSVCLLSAFETDGKSSIGSTSTVDTICPFSTLSNNATLSSLISITKNKSAASISNTQAKNISTYTGRGWDFANVWEIDNSYPILKKVHTEFETTPKGNDFFKLKEDTNQFVHTGFEYSFNNSEYRNQLYIDSVATWCGTLIIAKQLSSAKVKGVCHGIALSMCYANKGYLNLDKIKKGAKNYWELGNPNTNVALKDIILYYQLTQYTVQGETPTKSLEKGGWHITSLEERTKDFFQSLVSEAQRSQAENTPFVFSFNEKEGGHSVVVCGYTWDSVNDCHKLKIYDENSYSEFFDGSTNCKYTYLKIGSDYSWFDFADANAEYSGYKIQDVWISLKYYGIDQIYNRIKKMSTKKNGDCMVTCAEETDSNDRVTFFISDDEPFKIQNSEGKYIEYNGNEYKGDMEVFDCKKIGADLKGYWKITIPTSDCYVVTNFTKDFSIIGNTENGGFSIDNCDNDKIVIHKNKIDFYGEDYNFNISLQSNTCDFIEISAQADNKTSVNLTDSFTIDSEDTISDIQINRYEKFEAVNTENIKEATRVDINSDGERLNNSVKLTDMSINYKKTALLKPNIEWVEGSVYTVSYTSSNTSVARVDDNGNVYGAKRGSATITCTVTDEFGNTVSDSCNVNVKYSFGQWLIKILLFGWIWY